VSTVARKKIAVLISGRGSNLAALIEACRADGYPAEIALVVSNRPGARGLKLAEDAGIATATIDHKTYSSRESFEERLDAVLGEAKVEIICCAGFLRLLTDGFVERWRNRILNIHPSLLPAYRGLNTHERVLAEGGRITGCTVHFMRPEMDAGPIIAQAAVPVLGNDTADELAARVLKAEHIVYPLALRLVASGRIRLSGEQVVYEGDETPEAPLVSPHP